MSTSSSTTTTSGPRVFYNTMSDRSDTPPMGRFIGPEGQLLGTGPESLASYQRMSSGTGFMIPSISWVPFIEGGGGYPFTDPLIPPSPPPVFAGPSPSPIPPLISAHSIDEGDVNVLLGSVSNLPFHAAFKTLLASSMALWTASAPDVETIKSHGLDTAIDGFLEFISTPSFPTTISPVRLPIDIPPTPLFSDPLLPSPLPHDEDAVMASGDSSDTPSSHIRTPTPRPLEKGKMRAPEPPAVPEILAPTPVIPSSLPAPPAIPPSCAPVSDHARGRARPSVAQTRTGKKASFAEVTAKAATAPGPPNPPLGPKAAAAKIRAENPPPPPRPSLVLSLTHHTLASTLCATAALAPPVLVNACNAALSADPTHANVRVSAAKWSPKGNLVVFAGPGVSRDALFTTSHILTSAISRALPDDPRISSRLNVKWGKVMISSVPTGVSEESPSAHSPAAVWQSLIDNNPSLHRLKVCQLPSWVRRPSLFHLGSQSSLVLAFEDPDGTIAPSLICARTVYAFGSQCCIVRWRNPPPSPAKREAADIAKKARNARSGQESIAGSSRPSAPPPVSVTQLAAFQANALLTEGDMSAIPDIAAALTLLSKRGPTSSPPAPRSKKRKARSSRRRVKIANTVP